MPLTTIVRAHNLALDNPDMICFAAQLRVLDRYLETLPEPVAVLVLTGDPIRRQVQAEVRIQVAHGREDLVSYQWAPTAEQAVSLAVVEIQERLEALPASTYTVGVRTAACHGGAPPNPQPDAQRARAWTQVSSVAEHPEKRLSETRGDHQWRQR